MLREVHLGRLGRGTAAAVVLSTFILLAATGADAAQPAAAGPPPPSCYADGVEGPGSRPISGLDLTLHVWGYRIEVPWLKSLPITPGRRIVISIMSWDAALP